MRPRCPAASFSLDDLYLPLGLADVAKDLESALVFVCCGFFFYDLCFFHQS